MLLLLVHIWYARHKINILIKERPYTSRLLTLQKVDLWSMRKLDVPEWINITVVDEKAWGSRMNNSGDSGYPK